MVVDLVSGGTTCKDSNIGIVSVRKDPAAFALEILREEVGRPEDFWLVGSPSVVWVAVETVDEDNVDLGLWRRVDFGKAILANSRC